MVFGFRTPARFWGLECMFDSYELHFDPFLPCLIDFASIYLPPSSTSTAIPCYYSYPVHIDAAVPLIITLCSWLYLPCHCPLHLHPTSPISSFRHFLLVLVLPLFSAVALKLRSNSIYSARLRSLRLPLCIPTYPLSVSYHHPLSFGFPFHFYQ